MRRTLPLLAAVTLVLPLAGCGKAQAGEDSAWAGALCTATTNAYLSASLLANDVPPPEKLTASSLPGYQTRLGTELGEVGTSVDEVNTQLGSVPSGLTDTVASLTQPAADLQAAYDASESPVMTVVEASGVAAAESAMPAADAATLKTQATAAALAKAILALDGEPAFAEAPACDLPSPTPAAS